MVTVKLSRHERRFQALELGELFLCSGGKDVPEAPDYSSLADASTDNAEFAAQASRDQLAWAREQWADQKEMIGQVNDVQMPMMMAQVQMANQGMEAYMDALDSQTQIAWENQKNAMQDRDRYERVFQPIEDDLVMEAMTYDTEGRRALEAGRAQADVARSQDAQRKAAAMQLEGYGIDPSQTRSQALDAGLRTQQAASQAAAGNQARDKVENVGRAMRADAMNVGKGLPSQVANSYNTSLNASGGAQNAYSNAQNSLNSTANGLSNNASAWQGANSAMGGAQGWLGQSANSYGQSANMLSQGFQDQMTSFNAQQENSPWNAIAGLAGTGLAAYSTGGASLFMADGGPVEGPGGPKDDAIPAQLSHGEFIVPEEVSRYLGTKYLSNLVKKSKEEADALQAETEAQNQPPPQMSPGGPNPAAPVMMANGGLAQRTQPENQLGQPSQWGQLPQQQNPQNQQNQLTQQQTPQVGWTGQSVAPLMMAEGGAVDGSNPRSMFGYSSELANKGQQQANQRTTDRQAMVDNMRATMQKQEWKDVEPGWSPNTKREAGYDFAGAVKANQDARADRLAAIEAQKAAAAAQQAEAERLARMQAQQNQQSQWASSAERQRALWEAQDELQADRRGLSFASDGYRGGWTSNTRNSWLPSTNGTDDGSAYNNWLASLSQQ